MIISTFPQPSGCAIETQPGQRALPRQRLTQHVHPGWLHTPWLHQKLSIRAHSPHPAKGAPTPGMPSASAWGASDPPESHMSLRASNLAAHPGCSAGIASPWTMDLPMEGAVSTHLLVPYTRISSTLHVSNGAERSSPDTNLLGFKYKLYAGSSPG